MTNLIAQIKSFKNTELSKNDCNDLIDLLKEFDKTGKQKAAKIKKLGFKTETMRNGEMLIWDMDDSNMEDLQDGADYQNSEPAASLAYKSDLTNTWLNETSEFIIDFFAE